MVCTSHTREDTPYGHVVQRPPVRDGERGSVSSELAFSLATAVRGDAGTSQRLAFLAEAGRILASSLDYEETLANIARLIVPVLADYCVIDLVDPTGGARRVGIAHREPSREATLRDLLPMDRLDASTPQARALQTGESILVPEVRDEHILQIARDRQQLRAILELSPDSGMIVPLRVRGRALGVMTLVLASSTGIRYDSDDLFLVEELASRIALAVDRAHLYQEAQAEIRERRRAEARAEEILERYRIVARATNDVIWDWSLDTDVATYSESVEAMLGYTPDEILNHRSWWKDNIHPDDRDALLERIEKAFASDAMTISAEYRFRRADGSYATVLDRARILRDEDGRVVRVIGSMLDITERKRAEERQRFLAEASAILDSSLDYDTRLRELARLCVPTLGDFCLVDLAEDDGTFRRIEAAHADPARAEVMRKILRYPPSTTTHAGVSWAMRTRRSAIITEATDEMLQKIARNADHLALIREIAPVSMMTVPMIAKGRVLGTLTVGSTTPDRRYTEDDRPLVEDLAARAAMAIENARLYAQAQQANHAKSEFLSTMSHEFRTPLTAVIGYTDLLLAGVSGPLEEQQRQHLLRVRRSAWHLLDIIEEILTFSRIEAGREPIRVATVALVELAHQALDVVEPLASQKGLALEVDLPRDEVWIQTDPGKFRQILVNLLTNAVKYTETGTVRLGVSANDRTITCRVSDTGVGIEPVHLDHIFEPFWQVDQSTTRAIGGTGLGLGIVVRLTELLGGRIEVESTPGKGSTFTFHLPTRPPRSGAGEARGSLGRHSRAIPGALLGYRL